MRYTRPIHANHPGQRQAYIISDETAVSYKKGNSGIVTVNGPAITKLGQYEDMGTVEEVRQAMESFRARK